MYETARKLYKGSSTDRHEVIRDVLNKLAEKRPTAATIVEQSRRELPTPLHSCASRIWSLFTTRRCASSRCRSSSAASPWPVARLGTARKERHHVLQHLRLRRTGTSSRWSRTSASTTTMVRDLTVHEAMPGHYLQYRRESLRGADTRARCSGADRSRKAGPSMRSASWPSVVTADPRSGCSSRRCAAHDPQRDHRSGNPTKGMTEQQAMDLMMNEGFAGAQRGRGKVAAPSPRRLSLRTMWAPRSWTSFARTISASMGPSRTGKRSMTRCSRSPHRRRGTPAS